MIRVQAEDFDVGALLTAFTAADAPAGGPGAGAVATFLGRVRSEDGQVQALTLEHYPGMTEKSLTAIEAEARRRWPLADVLIVHRYGRLEPGASIVFVATAASHRAAAFDACGFLVDWLKTKAPFWKLEEGPGGAQWVEAKASDDAAAAAWVESIPSTPDRL